MIFKGTIIVVKDSKASYKFYHNLFGFELIHDNDGNMELHFENDNVEEFVKKLERLYPHVKYANTAGDRKLSDSMT